MNRPVPSPEMVRNIWKHMRKIHSRNADAYKRFVEAARGQLPDHSDAPQFTYIVRRIWLSYEEDAQAFFEHFICPTLRSEYEGIDATTEWLLGGKVADTWITVELVKRTLSVWQAILPFYMSPDHALRLLRSAGRLRDLGVQL